MTEKLVLWPGKRPGQIHSKIVNDKPPLSISRQIDGGCSLLWSNNYVMVF